MTISDLSHTLAPEPELLTPVFGRGGRRRNYDDSPPVVGTYSVKEIKEFNPRHDKFYGFNLNQGNYYTNNTRLPETFHGPVSELWNR